MAGLRIGGGTGYEYAYDVGFGEYDELYVTGKFQGTVDFDPGTGVDNHTAAGTDIFICKYDSRGDFLWARTWGGTASYDRGLGICVAADGFYVTGAYGGTNVDFDPGAGTDFHSSYGAADMFLSKFDWDGNFLWARTWGGTSDFENCNKLTSVGSSVYVTGAFWSVNVDFDPGPGTFTRSSQGDHDIFLSKFNNNGDFQWARFWGAGSIDRGLGVTCDESSNVYMVGCKVGNIDLDPGTGTHYHPGGGSVDPIIVKLNSTGGFVWGHSWGSSSADYGYDIKFFSNDVYITGNFQGTNVDFNPDLGVELHSSVYATDSYLQKFDKDGNFQWARTWGGAQTGASTEAAYGVDSAGLSPSYVYVTGAFGGTNVDFDPGPGTDYHSSTGNIDGYLCSYDENGGFFYANTWGGGNDSGYSVVVSDSPPGYVYVCGFFEGANVDFDPGLGVDYHSASAYDAFLSRYFWDGPWYY